MTCTRVLAAAAVLALACGCNPLTGADEVDTDPSNPGPNVDPKDQMKDAPATPTITCAYPTLGNMGVDTNQVVPREKKWQGLGPGDTASREVSIAELFDCDGSKLINGHPVNAIMVDTSQYG